MKKLLLFGVFTLCSFVFVNAQISVLSSYKLLAEENPTLRATYATMTCEQTHYEPGDTVLIFNYHHNFNDDNAGGISLKFPEGVEVITASAISGDDGGLGWMGVAGDGVLTHWGNITNPSWPATLQGNASGEVSVIVDESFTGNLNIDWEVVGDGAGNVFSNPPYTNSGTIVLYRGYAYDMAVEDITPNVVFESEPVNPTVIVRNYGINNVEEFSVTLTDNVSYDETINITGEILSGESYTIEFPVWTPTEGIYTLTATVDLIDDDNTDNDTLEKEITVYGHEPIFSYIAGLATAETGFCATYYLGTSDVNYGYLTGDFIIKGGVVIGDNLYGMSTAGNFGYFSEDLSSWNNIGTTTFQAIWSMAYDIVNDKIYTFALIDTPNPQTINLLEIDKNTAVTTLIAESPHSGSLVAIAVANNGDLYGVMHKASENGELYKIDVNTAEITLIGDLGSQISNNLQALTFDPATNICYFQAYGSEEYLNGTYVIDIETGVATLVGEPLDLQVTAIGIPGELGGPHLLSTIPEDGEIDVAIDTGISATFDVNIFEIDLLGVTIEPDPGNVVATIDGATVNIAHDDLAYNTTHTVTIPAGSIDDGTLELFYDVVWSFTTALDPFACNIPTDLEVTNITAYTAELSWTENGPAEEWKIEYGYYGFTLGEGTVVTATTNPYVLEGLEPETVYEFYVTSVCGVDDESPAAGPLNFETLESCPAPTDLDATQLSDTSYELSWTAGGEETTWNVEYGLYGYEQGSDEAIETNYGTNSNTWVITDLNETATYEFYVQADCGAVDGESVWVGPFIFNEQYDVFTYNEGDISAQHVHATQNWYQSDCPGILTVNVPDGYIIRAVDVSYDIATTAIGRMQDQRSRLRCVETSTSTAKQESADAVSGETGQGTHSYERTNLSFANDLKGEVEFQLHMGSVWPEVMTRICQSTHNFVVNETWILKVYYIEDPYTEIAKETSHINVNIYPNPSTGLVNINVDENSTVRILDISGRVIDTHKVNANQTINFTQSKGMYIIQVESESEVSNHKVIIQ